MATVKKNTVERKIYFYRADIGVDGGGKPLPFDPTTICNHIDSLSFETSDRYWEDESGNATLCWVDRHVPNHRLRLATIRRVDLPQFDQRGVLSPLGLPEDAGLAEPIHIVFFPNNILGADFNFYGPRLSRLRDYLAAKAKGVCPTIEFMSLLRHDVAQQLDQLLDIRLIQLKIQASYADTVAQANQDLGAAFEAAARAGVAKDVEIIIRPELSGAALVMDGLMQSLKRLALRNDVHGKASRFIVKGKNRATRRVEAVDLLSDQLIAKKQIVKADERTRVLDLESAYAAIEEAYEELHDELETAAGLRL